MRGREQPTRPDVEAPFDRSSEVGADRGHEPPLQVADGGVVAADVVSEDPLGVVGFLPGLPQCVPVEYA